MAVMEIKSVTEEPHLETTCEDSSEVLPQSEDSYPSVAQESPEVPIPQASNWSGTFFAVRNSKPALVE